MYEQELRMTGTAGLPPQIAPDESVAEVMQTRFGEVTIYRTNPLVFPNGMLGLPDKFEYCLTKLPSEKLARFKLLQSLDDAELSFITLPVDVDNKIIERKDVEVACRDLAYDISSVTIRGDCPSRWFSGEAICQRPRAHLYRHPQACREPICVS